MLYDILFTLDAEGCLNEVAWGSKEAEELYRDLFESWAAIRRPARDAFDLPREGNSGELLWEENTFHFQFLPAPDNGRWLLLKREDNRLYLLARALDQITNGVQIYDKNACAVYFNKASRGISHIPSGVNVEGRHLLDLYNLDETVSTTMTALQTQAPVIDRVDSFRANDFSTAPIASANTSYPIFREGELLGAVVFEQTAEIADKNIKKLEATRRALSSFQNKPPKISFSGYTFDNVIGSCPKLRQAVELAQKVAPQDSPILLVGETGTGKEIFAQSIHRASRRRSGKFLAINCAAVPETLIESLLFGTKRGSFTGSEDKAGYLEEAAGGTLFLDELNSMSLSMQAKLLRVLEEGTLQRVGSTKDIRVDIRVLSACNQDAFALMENGTLRRDLFYRLASAVVEIPPLRERMEDLEELVWYFMRERSPRSAQPVERIEPGFWACLRQYSWPGNVRELFHILECSVSVSRQGVLRRSDLPVYFLRHSAPPARTAQPAPASSPERMFQQGLDHMVQEYERQVLSQAYLACGKNATQTAELLKISRQSFQYYKKKYNL